ncbi:MAG: zonular occludens toxin domain-containing protein [Candidatus Woesearchaeota archaeon]
MAKKSKTSKSKGNKNLSKSSGKFKSSISYGAFKSFKNWCKKNLSFIYYPVLIVYYIIWAVYKVIYWLFYGIYKFGDLLIKAVIWIYRLFYKATDKTTEFVKKKKTDKKRSEFSAEYEAFNLIEHDSGKLEDFEKKLMKSDSTIGIVLGARGSGKTAISVKLLENIYAKTGKKCFALGFKEEDMPLWIDVVDDIKYLKNDSFALIDEGGILFSSRRSMAEPNKLLSELMLIARHKNISIIFISQNSSNLEINAIRQADYLVLKKSSLLQKDFERKKIKEIYEQIGNRFNNYKNMKGITFVYSDEFTGFVENPLPSFWSKNISKSFRKDKEEK